MSQEYDQWATNVAHFQIEPCPQISPTQALNHPPASACLPAPSAGSVIWKCVLRFGGTLLAGLLGLGVLYFTVLCNGLSFENKPAKVGVGQAGRQL